MLHLSFSCKYGVCKTIVNVYLMTVNIYCKLQKKKMENVGALVNGLKRYTLSQAHLWVCIHVYFYIDRHLFSFEE